MTRYDPLELWLRSLDADSASLSFGEIEAIVGVKLPRSSYTYEAHWRGTTPGRPGGAIAAAGWRVERIDWLNATIALRRARIANSRLGPIAPRDPSAGRTTLVAVELPSNTWRALEIRAARYFSALWDTDLRSRAVDVRGVVKNFDLVSSDGRFVGDAKLYADMANPAAKLSTIAEYVWLLQNVHADRKFLVFGGDGAVAKRFLTRWRPVSDPIEFYLLTDQGHELL